MNVEDKILSRYFLIDEYYELKAKVLESERQMLMGSAYAHTIYTDEGIKVVGASVEEITIAALEISERASRLKNSVERTQDIFSKAVKKLSARERILLSVYYRSGVSLANDYELNKTKERMIDSIEQIKEKEDRVIKRDYMQQCLVNQ